MSCKKFVVVAETCSSFEARWAKQHLRRRSVALSAGAASAACICSACMRYSCGTEGLGKTHVVTAVS